MKTPISVAIKGNFRKGVSRTRYTEPYYSDLINVYKYWEGGYKNDGARLFSLVPSDWKRGNGHKLKHRKHSEHEETLVHCEGG